MSFTYTDLHRMAYAEALEKQTEAFCKLLAAKAAGNPGENRLFFCEHDPVLTIGKNGKNSNLLIPESVLKTRNIAYYHTDRGGDITYHGPGQLTGYPVFDLETFAMGLKQYIHTLEEAVIRFLALHGIQGERLQGASGVWLDACIPGKARKICAVGVRSSRYVTMHGFALNIDPDLSYFSFINPCGFTDKGVTSLTRETGKKYDMAEVKAQLLPIFEELFR